METVPAMFFSPSQAADKQCSKIDKPVLRRNTLLHLSQYCRGGSSNWHETEPTLSVPAPRWWNEQLLLGPCYPLAPLSQAKYFCATLSEVHGSRQKQDLDEELRQATPDASEKGDGR